jgi:sugar/nucleoside kinase (ribokinase family)
MTITDLRLTRSKWVTVEPLSAPVRVVDEAGAGDALVASLLSRLLHAGTTLRACSVAELANLLFLSQSAAAECLGQLGARSYLGLAMADAPHGWRARPVSALRREVAPNAPCLLCHSL